MENSSKVLLIAAAILIVIIIISVSIRILNTTNGVSDNAEQVGESIKTETITVTDKLLGVLAQEDLSSEEAVTNYTLEEIKANNYLYAIGKTETTYVVAKFNEDFTEVTITKNGKNSDGIITDYDPHTSPMYDYKDTLNKVVIRIWYS